MSYLKTFLMSTGITAVSILFFNPFSHSRIEHMADQMATTDSDKGHSLSLYVKPSQPCQFVGYGVAKTVRYNQHAQSSCLKSNQK